MDVDRLFLHTYEDLIRRSSEKLDEYNLLQIAALLRKLLLDGDQSLALLANRRRRLKIKFAITDGRLMKGREGVAFHAVGDGFQAGMGLPGDGSRVVKIDGLLAATIMRIGERRISVRDAILYCANSQGGVHFGERQGLPNKEADGFLDFTTNVMRIGGMPPGAFALRGITRAVLAGLEPLYHAVTAKSSAATGGGAPSP